MALPVRARSGVCLAHAREARARVEPGSGPGARFPAGVRSLTRHLHLDAPTCDAARARERSIGGGQREPSTLLIASRNAGGFVVSKEGLRVRPPETDVPPTAALTTQSRLAAGSHAEPAAAVDGPSRTTVRGSKRQRQRNKDARRRAARAAGPRLVSELVGLGRVWFDVSQCIATAHGERRMAERGFDLASFRSAWFGGQWEPDGDDETAFVIRDGRSKFVVALGEDRVALLTAVYLAAHQSVG